MRATKFSMSSTIAVFPIAIAAFTPLSPLAFTRAAHAQEQLWITQFGRTGSDIAFTLSPDGAGGVMVSGLASHDLGGPPAGGPDVFLGRYGAAGNQIWMTQFGSNTDDWGMGLPGTPARAPRPNKKLSKRR